MGNVDITEKQYKEFEDNFICNNCKNNKYTVFYVRNKDEYCKYKYYNCIKGIRTFMTFPYREKDATGWETLNYYDNIMVDCESYENKE